jgi:acetyl-CoA carboxylase biotin carboxylase subunit
MKPIRRLLAANRSEIAIRVFRSAHELGIRTVAIYSYEDRYALHRFKADEAYLVGQPGEPIRSYLNIPNIIAVAREHGVNGIHPGYGFMSENPELARACAEAGITFVGPHEEALKQLGDKTFARNIAQQADVPVLGGSDAIGSVQEGQALAAKLGFPVILKAAKGGGGRGMRVVKSAAEFAPSFEQAQRESLTAFGSPDVFIEKYITRASHIEVQILGDQHGNLVHLFERDCSIQRRHQKIVEETPCPVLTAETLARMGEVAVRGASAIGYFSAGTFEFLLAPDGSFHFLEMNTRLQVEHPITELVTGLDLVREMVRVARGEALGFERAERRGAALEVRVYAEDPASGFLPSPGKITRLQPASGPFVRDDSGVYEGALVSPSYDPLLAKLSVWGENRGVALARMRRALADYTVAGIRTNLAFLARVIAHPDFIRGEYDIGFVGAKLNELLAEPSADDATRWLIAAAAAVATQIEAEGAEPRPAPAGTGLSPWVSAQRSALKW